MAQNPLNTDLPNAAPDEVTLRAAAAVKPLHLFYTDDPSWTGSANRGIKPNQSEIQSAVDAALPDLSDAQSVSLHFRTENRTSNEDRISKRIMEALTATRAPGLEQLSVSFRDLYLYQPVNKTLQEGVNLLGHMDSGGFPSLKHISLYRASFSDLVAFPACLVKLDINHCRLSSGIDGIFDMLSSSPGLQELSLATLRFNIDDIFSLPRKWSDQVVRLPHLRAFSLHTEGGPRMPNTILSHLEIMPSCSITLESTGSPPTQKAWEDQIGGLARTLTTHFRGHAFERLSLSMAGSSPALDLHASSSGSLGPLRVQFGNLESRLRDGLRIFLASMPALQAISKLTLVPLNMEGIRSNERIICGAREILRCLRGVEELEIVDKGLNRFIWDVLGPTIGGQLRTEAVFPCLRSLTATMDNITPTEWRLLAARVAWRKDLALCEVIIALWGSAELAEAEGEQLSDAFGASINAKVSKLQEPPEAMVGLLKANESSNTQTGAPATEGPDDSDSEDIDTDSDY